jgi:hypothetical protein
MQLIETINNKNYRIDLATRQITFLDSRFYITDEGNYVPSVTTILEAYPKGAQYYEWLKKNGEDSDTIRDEAGRRGSVVHHLTERYDAGEEVSLFNEQGNITCKLGEWNMFEKYVEFRKKTEWTIALMERNFISESLGYAGTVDRVFEFAGKKILVDIKTSAAIYTTHLLQLTAYYNLLSDAGIIVDEVAILHMNAKTRSEGKKDAIQGKGWQLVRYTAEELLSAAPIFEATKQLWNAENATSVPRQMVYNLSHKL